MSPTQQHTPNLPTKILQTKILWLNISGTPFGRENSSPQNQDSAWVKPSEIENLVRRIGLTLRTLAAASCSLGPKFDGTLGATTRQQLSTWCVAIRDVWQNTILYYTILYYTILYYTIIWYTIIYDAILYYTILHYTILCYTILHFTTQFDDRYHQI